jgi:hypothetical protein
MLFMEEIRSTNEIALRKLGGNKKTLKPYEKSIKVELKVMC